MIERIVSRISANLPDRLRGSLPEAAVLIPVTKADEPEIILTRRSQQMNTHGGQVAFPGGMKDSGDKSLIDTALREAKEEIGLELGSVEVIGALSQVLSKHRIKVSPYVGLVDPSVKLSPCPDELESLFRVPVSFFLNTLPDRIDRFGSKNTVLVAPCWHFYSYEIWGMSAAILANFLQVAFDFKIDV